MQEVLDALLLIQFGRDELLSVDILKHFNFGFEQFGKDFLLIVFIQRPVLFGPSNLKAFPAGELVV